MSTVYSFSPLRFRLPEFNGGAMTDTDVFPGMNYYTSASDLIIEDSYSSVFSNNFNIYSSAVAPKLVQYIPSIDAFSLTFYKGIYIYNPSMVNDKVVNEAVRFNIDFSITGGSTFVLDEPEELFYEGTFYKGNLNNEFSLNGLDRTSANDNIKISISPESSKNKPLNYFNIDGTSPVLDISSRDFFEGNLGVNVPSLNPGDYFGLYLKFESSFRLESKPIDYAFLNLSYFNDNSVGGTEMFPSKENIPGKTLTNANEEAFYLQSFSLKFNTNTTAIRNILRNKVNVIYDNYPPFFSDYRDSETVVID